MPVALSSNDLEGLLPLAKIVEALDDNGDGEADAAAWTAVLEAANGRLAAAAGDADLTNEVATWAVKIFCAEILFNRRGYSEARNPFYAQAKGAEERVRQVADDTELDDEAVAGGVVLEDVKLSNRTQRLI